MRVRKLTMGQKLKAWRDGRDLTQKDAAEAAGFSQALWSKLEDDMMKRVGLDVARRVVELTRGTITLDDFPSPTGQPVQQIPEPDSTTNIVDDDAVRSA